MDGRCYEPFVDKIGVVVTRGHTSTLIIHKLAVVVHKPRVLRSGVFREGLPPFGHPPFAGVTLEVFVQGVAGSGFGAGCAALLCGALRSGITTVLDTVDFDRRAVGCDLVVTGEGSSGGALALGVANHILMLENAVYSVLSPEGFASILWKDSSRSGEACEIMKLTAQDLYKDGIVEEIIPEPVGGAQRSHAALFAAMDTALKNHLTALCKMSGKALADQRYKKFRQIGEAKRA